MRCFSNKCITLQHELVTSFNIMMKKNILFLTLFWSFLAYTTVAQPDLHFKQITVAQGLSSNSVNAIIRDSKGFMWLGTSVGLDRFDGYNFKKYYSNPLNNKSLPDNGVTDLVEDAIGNIWVKTYNGYAIYDYKKEYFIRDIRTYLIKMKPEFQRLKSIEYIYVDNDKNLWIYDSEKKLYYYRFRENELRIYSSYERKMSSSKLNNIVQMGHLFYIIYQSGELECLAPMMNKVVMHNNFLSRVVAKHLEQYYIYADKSNGIWITSGFPIGVWSYDTHTGKWTHLSKESKGRNKLNSDIIHKVVDDGKSNIYMATDHGGINVYNKHTGKITFYCNDPTDHNSIAGNTLYTIYFDNENTLWAGTFKKGVSYYSSQTQKFKTFHFKDKNNPESPNDINCICTDLVGNLWFGTDGEGLVKYSSKTKQTTYFQAKNSPNSLSGNIIVSIMCDSKNRIWMGTYLNGLCCYDKGRFIQYKHNDNNPNSLCDNNIWDIAEDNKGFIWIATLDKGLQKLNINTGQFTTYNYQQGLNNNSIVALCKTKGNIIYAGTSSDVEEININTNKIRTIQNGIYVTCLYKDNRGLLWIGSTQGLRVYDIKSGHITNIALEKNNNDIMIKGIIEDNNNNMWITTGNWLTNLIISNGNKSNKLRYNILNYDQGDGLQSTFFNGRSFCKTSDGKIYVGCDEGYNIIEPNNIIHNHYQPKVGFTNLEIYNNSVNVDSLYNGHKILEASLSETKRLDFNYTVKMFSIEFSAFDYATPSKCKYAYMLKGFNTNWITTNENKVTFTNLDAGKYTLLVKATNSDGFWNNAPSTITIVVHPPFWKTWKAYIVYFIIFILAIYYYINQNKKKQEEKLHLQRIEIESKRQKEMNEMKMRFFTNVSHDFRTPLSLIITPLEKLIDEQKGAIKEQLQLIHQNAQELLTLVNQLLDFRRLDANKEKLNLLNGNIILVINNIIDSFKVYVEQKHIKLNYTTDATELETTFDKDKIEKIMMNLLSNAFKFTPESGTIDVNEFHDKKNVYIEVADNGININDKDKEHIFDRFYQVHQPKMNEGSGIGLHIVKGYAKLHGGKVKITDNKPQGVIFTVKLPIRHLVIEDEKESYIEKVITEEVPTLSENTNEENKTTHTRKNPTILIVEDNENFKNFIISCLNDEYNVFGAANGKEAIKMIEQHEINIILSDIMMPVMDGLELCKAVKSNINYSHIPIILITARTAEEHRMEGLQYGADDYITKPFNLKILKLRISKFVEWSRRSHENFTKKLDITPSEITISSLDEKLMQKAMKNVEDNIGNPDFSVEELSEDLGLSRGHLYKKLMNITGKSPLEFIRIIRLKRSQQYLKESQMSISEIAYTVGFNSPKNFARYFKEEFGKTPSEYIKDLHNK